MISLLVSVLVILIVLYVVKLVLAELALPPSIRSIAYLIVGLIVLVMLLRHLGVALPEILR